MILLYTDGSSLTPGGIGAWAYTAVVQLDRRKFATTEAEGVELASGCGAFNAVTNNQMEMRAILHGLERMQEFDTTRGVTVVSDSKYALDGICTWRDGWERKGMRTAAGRPVLNAELWQDVWKRVDSCKYPLFFEHIRGHRGVFWNEHVDRLARNTALALKEEQRHIHEYHK